MDATCAGWAWAHCHPAISSMVAASLSTWIPFLLPFVFRAATRCTPYSVTQSRTIPVTIPKLMTTQNSRQVFWGSSSPRYSLIHCRGSWSQHPVFRPLKPFYYRKSLWPFLLRVSHISVVCRRCLIFSRENPLRPQKCLLFVPWNSI